MSKYNICEKYGIFDFGDRVLEPETQNLVKVLLMEKTANELAEANRLKRLEMRLKDYGYLDSDIAFKHLLEDLKDKA